MKPQDLIDLQETFQSVGWKIYQGELIKAIKYADNHLHRKETPIEDLRYWQGQYDGVYKILNIPQDLIQKGEKILKEENRLATVKSEEGVK